MAPQTVDLVLGELKHEVGRKARDIALGSSVERLVFDAIEQNNHAAPREIYAEGEFDEPATCKAFLQVRTEGARQVSHNLRCRTRCTGRHTAVEIVHERTDGEKPFMGMQTTRPGGVVRKADASIAKNYLTEPLPTSR